jgi:hypothetical protein
MRTPSITSKTTMTELAALVSEALAAAGIVATLSGGSAVSVYTENRYESEDLDFVTAALLEELKPVLEPMGFVHTGSPRLSVFEHSATRWYLEFPPAPLSFGGTYVDASACVVLSTPAGNVRIVSATHSVMDRLIAAASWQDAPSLDQAVLVATHQSDNIDWDEIDAWVVAEGISAAREVIELYRAVKRSPPLDRVPFIHERMPPAGTP